MSIGLMNAISDCEGLDDEGLANTLVWMANYAADDGSHCWPAVVTLARKCKVDRRTIQRRLRKLEDDGWIKTVGQSGNHTTEYQIVVERIQQGAAPCRGGGGK